MKKLMRVFMLSCVLVLALGVSAMATDAPPSVMVNGEVVDFPDAVPQIVDGRTYIPLRAVFNVLGFADDAITWDGATRTATAVKDDLTVAITEGVKSVTVTEAGDTKTIETDAAAYVEAATGRTLVPIRFVAEAVGCNVGWDGTTKTAIIDDTAAILAANTETYELMDKYMAYNNSFADSTYAVTGSYTMDMTTDGEKMAVTGDYEMLTDSTKAQFTSTMNLSGTASGQDLSAQLPEGGLDMDLRFDLDTGVYYLHSEALNEMMGVGISGVWYKMDLGSLLDQMGTTAGMDYSSLMALAKAAKDMTFTQYLESTLRSLPLNDATATTSDVLALINQLCADSAFKKSGSTYTSTLEQDGATVKFSLYTSGGKVNGYSVSVDAADMMELTATMKDSKMDLTMTMAVDIPAVEGVSEASSMSMEMTMDGKYTAAKGTPAAEPPAGAGIIDLMELMNAAG